MAKEIKGWLTENEFNSIWAWLQTIFSAINELNNLDVNSIDFIWKINRVASKIILNWLNIARHSISKIFNLAFTWIKEFKNYYLKSTWEESEHWVYIQQMHSKRDDYKDSTFISEETAWMIDWWLTSSMTMINWWSDALLDYLWFVINIVVTPENTINKITKFSQELFENINISEITESILGWKIKNLTPEILNKMNYIVSYIVTYITLWSLTWTSAIWTLNKTVTNWLSFISKISWKSQKALFKLLQLTDKVSWKLNRTNSFNEKSFLQNQLAYQGL